MFSHSRTRLGNTRPRTGGKSPLCLISSEVISTHDGITTRAHMADTGSRIGARRHGCKTYLKHRHTAQKQALHIDTSMRMHMSHCRPCIRISEATYTGTALHTVMQQALHIDRRCTQSCSRHCILTRACDAHVVWQHVKKPEQRACVDGGHSWRWPCARLACPCAWMCRVACHRARIAMHVYAASSFSSGRLARPPCRPPCCHQQQGTIS